MKLLKHNIINILSNFINTYEIEIKMIILYVILIIGSGILTNCNNTQNRNLSKSVTSIKSKTGQGLENNHHNSYYFNNTLIVIDKNKNKIKKIKIFASDSLYRIVQSQNENYLFVGLSSYGDAIFQFMGLIDLKSKRWIIYEKLDSKANNWRNNILSNPRFVGTTTDNKYHLFEGGTGTIRDFQICDASGSWIKKGTYVIGIDNYDLKWDIWNRILYFERADSFPNYLQKPREGFGYVQKKFWQQGKDSLTLEFKEIYFQ